MKRFFRITAVTVLLVISLLCLATPVFAIANPDTLQINAVWVYRNCLETNDQLYIVDYTIDYTNPPPNPDENVTDAYLCRLMEGAVELGSVAPYAFFDDGYDRGVVALYFSASDIADAGMGWDTGTYSMILIGNPTLGWPGDPPETTVATFDLWQDWPIETTQTILSSRILWLGDQLELDWAIDMVETTASGTKLTATYGEGYFINVIENLRIMAPYAFAGQITQPEVEKREYTQSYAGDLAGSITGTPLDLSALATALGVSNAMLTAVLFFGAVAILIALSVKYLGTYKPAMLMSIPCIVGGALLGIIPLVIAIMLGFGALVMTGYVLFYQKSGA